MTRAMHSSNRKKASRSAAYAYGSAGYLDRTAVTILAGHAWSVGRGRDPYFDPLAYEADRLQAQNLLRDYYNGKSLDEFLQSLVEAQEEAVLFGRHDSAELGQARREAELYTAFLLATEIMNHYLDEDEWPIGEQFLSKEVLQHLALISPKEYARISAYLDFIGRGSHGYHEEDYQAAWKRLGRFLEASRKRKRRTGNNNDRLSKAERKRIDDFMKEFPELTAACYNSNDTPPMDRVAIRARLESLCADSAAASSMLEFLIRCLIHSDAAATRRSLKTLSRSSRAKPRQRTVAVKAGSAVAARRSASAKRN